MSPASSLGVFTKTVDEPFIFEQVRSRFILQGAYIIVWINSKGTTVVWIWSYFTTLKYFTRLITWLLWKLCLQKLNICVMLYMQLTPHRGGVAGVTYFGYSAFDVNICLIYHISLERSYSSLSNGLAMIKIWHRYGLWGTKEQKKTTFYFKHGSHFSYFIYFHNTWRT